ncbi:TMEM175 family protein [uncultured Methanoregula sp.]|uniref:TMEM175 family protein n=1 Tax=uncultured Methanoregula sp. TaxID=1005933 RepID=UPI002AAB1F81|nr:TMEM175 family protein [uncultured Methanoregula sp.]
MEEKNEAGEEMHLTKGRLEALSDGIFAFAMTLLVIGMNLPDKATLVQSNQFALQFLLSLYSDFFHYVLAFLILGAFWLSQHQQFHSVRVPDKIFIWINLVTLMFVALLPFSTSFSGDFPHASMGAIVFEANLFIIGMGMTCQWWYGTKGSRLTEPTVKPAYVHRVLMGNLVVPAVSLIAILIALTGSLWSTALYITLPFVDYAVHRHFRNR